MLGRPSKKVPVASHLAVCLNVAAKLWGGMAGEIFISYRRADEAWARLLHSQLKAEGVEAWYDAQVGAGQDWRISTAKALQASQIFVLLFSENAAQSSDIAKELAAAVFEKKLIIPVRLENIAPSGAFLYELASRNWVNAFENTEAKLAELAKGLAHLVRTGARDEAILPFERDPLPRPNRWYRTAAIAAAIIVAAAGAASFFWMEALPKASAPPPASPRVAVRLFQPLSDDPALRQFAGGLQGEMAGELSDNQVTVVSAHDSVSAQPSGAAKTPIAYTFDGTVERSGGKFLVRAHMDDARQGVTVWSSDFSGDVGASELLQKEIGAIASQVGKIAISFDAKAKGDADAMSLYIKSVLYAYADRPQDQEAEWENMQQLVEKFPKSADFQSNFAIISAYQAVNSSPARAAQLRSVARTGAQRALALNPHASAAFFAQALILPSIGHWTQRENIFLQGLKAVPRDSLLTNHESNLLREVGRIKDAVAYGRQTQAVLPRTANRDSTLILALAAAGNTFEGDALAETAAKSWPLHPAVWNARLQLAIFNDRWDAALALLAPGEHMPVPDAVAHAWRGALLAAKSGEPAAKQAAARELVAQLTPAAIWASPPPNEMMSPGDSIGLLAMLGDKDVAFAQAETYLKRDSYADSSFLFWPSLQDFRRDPRFMILAARIGLTNYWQSSRTWPDFCAQPGLAYDCRTAAAKLAGTR